MTVKCQFKDKGSVIELVIDHSGKSLEDVSVNSNTTSLFVNDASGKSIVSVPQLQGTIDASQTEWSVAKDQLTIKLHKLGTDAWTALEASEEVQEPGDKQGDAGTALAARQQVKLLFEAVMRGDISEITSLARQVSPEGLQHVKDGNGRNALHFAAHAGQVGAIVYLLDQEGMDINAQDDAGETALGLAAAASQLPVVTALLKRGASVNLDKGKPQPLHRAAATASGAVVSKLLEAGAEKEAESSTGTPLLWAAGSGNADAIKALLNADVDFNAVSSDGCSAILMAAVGGEKEIVEALLSRGANASLAAEAGVTALHAAAEMGHLNLIKTLVQSGANTDAEDSEGSKPIHAAASSGHREVVEYLLPRTKPPGGSQWSVDALMAETSSVSQPSPSQQPARDVMQDVTQNDEDQDPEKAETFKRSGNEAFVAKDFDKAEACYTNALKHNSNDETVWCNRSAANLRLGRLDTALSDARKARSLKVEYMKAWFREGEAAKALNKWEEAAQAYYEAYTLNPSDDRLAQQFKAAIDEGRKAHILQQKQAQSNS